MRQNRPKPSAPLRALLVDDDPFVRLASRCLLEMLGFQVTEACDGLQAMQLAMRENADYRLVVSDFNMPRLNGAELLQALETLRPDWKVVLCSGNSEWECLHGQPLANGLFLPKPFNFHDLASAVQRVLGHAPWEKAANALRPSPRLRGAIA